MPDSQRLEPIFQGLQYVATGRSGSEACPPDLCAQILDDILSNKVNPITLSAFYTGLFFKGCAESEQILKKALPDRALDDSAVLVHTIAEKSPKTIQSTCISLLNGEHLTKEQAHQVGRYLLSDEPDDATRAMIATLLRVRYTESQEYVGLLDAVKDTYQKDKTESCRFYRPIIQFAEPFNGVDRFDLITPLLASVANKFGYDPVFLMGRSSGPKYGVGLIDLCQAIKNLPGVYLHQKDLSPALDRWVEIRKLILRRPFLATLERLVNPFDADVLVVSAFHYNFQEKMVEIAEDCKYKCIVVVFKGSEGSLGLSLARSTQVLISKRQSDGSYQRLSLKYTPQEFGFENQPEPKNQKLVANENIRRVQSHLETGTSGDPLFDQRVKYSQLVFGEIIQRLALPFS